MPDNTTQQPQEPREEKIEVKNPSVQEKPIDEIIEEKPIEIPQEPYRTSPLFYEIAGYFGIEEREYENAKEKLSVITDWAIQEAKSNKVHDLLPVIRSLEEKLSAPSWGETRYNNIYRYLRLAMKKDAFEKAMGAYEKMGGKVNGTG